MKDSTQTLLRSVLKLGAGYLASKGVGDQSAWELIVSGIIAAIGIKWGLVHRTPAVAPVASDAPLSAEKGWTRAPEPPK